MRTNWPLLGARTFLSAWTKRCTAPCACGSLRHNERMHLRLVIFAATLATLSYAAEAAPHLQDGPERWRAQRRIIDLHQHIGGTTQHLARAVRIMDAVGIGLAANLSGATVTPGKNGGPSEFERIQRLSDALFPGRFIQYFSLDYAGWDAPDFAERAARQVEEAHRLGAAGLKEFKRLGLFLRDGQGKLIKVDDPTLDLVWRRCGELGMPVSIHVADPKAFWLPYNEQNERWKELKDHPSWWFGDTNKYPTFEELLAALNRVIERHPKTTFVCVHFANNAEDLDWVDRSLSRYPNMMADLAARIPELGRHDPAKVRRLFAKHQDRIFFATDFQVYNRMILGSSGPEPAPTEADAEVFFAKEWRWLETKDNDWEHMTPIQGDWKISSIDLPVPVLRKVYFDNARRLLARALPTPILQARRISQDFTPDGRIDEELWHTATPALVDRGSRDAVPRPEVATEVRALWTTKHLYLAFTCPFTKLTVFQSPTSDRERVGGVGESLWDRDVVEAFIAPDSQHPGRYAEFEVAPTAEKLDVLINGPEDKDFEWSSGFVAATHLDRNRNVWTCEMRIPLEKFAGQAPAVGKQWRLNLYRCDRANRAFLAWNPVLTGSFHTPERFGTLEFTE